MAVATIPVSVVESDTMRCISDKVEGCLGRMVRLRQYVVRDNPDQRPSENMTNSVIAKWAVAGMPDDAVFYLGSHYRVTRET